MRARGPRLRKASFLAEWVAITGAILAVALANRAALALLATPQPRLGLTLIQVILTVAAYPLLVGLARLALGLRRPAGDSESLGGRA